MLLRKPMRARFALLSLLLACGPAVSEGRLVQAPPKPENCELKFIEFTGAVTDAFEVLGHVYLKEPKKQDPLSASYKHIVHARACAMGGEAVTLDAEAPGASSVSYTVLRTKSPEKGKPAPKKF
jgi:hypothetical protein